MKVLVIDTALGACAAGVFEEGRSLGERREFMTKGHQERLGGLVRDAVADAHGFAGIDRIGVTVGPGSFTGLRVGLAFAQGLGAALDRPVIGVSTLDALAASAPSGGLVAAVIDARRGQVYIRLFRDGEPLGPPEALPLETAVERILEAGGEDGPFLAGSGAALLAQTFAGPLGDARVLDVAAPSPQVIARLTLAADPLDAPPRPLYLRAPDATPPSRLPGQPRAQPA